MIYRHSLFAYLLVIILISSSIVMGSVVLQNRRLISRILFSSQEEKFTSLIKTISDEIELRLTSVEEAIKRNSLLYKESEENRSRDRSEAILSQTLNAFPSIFAMEIIFAKDEKEMMARNGFQAIYAWRDNQNDSIKMEDRNDPDSDYRFEWYRRPAEMKQNMWSSPYYDPQIGVLMITFSVPVMNDAGKVEAMMTADVSLQWLEDLIISYPIAMMGESVGEPVFFTPDLEICSIYNSKLYRRSLLALAQEDPDPKNKDAYKKLINSLVNNPSDKVFFYRPSKQEDVWLYFSELPKIRWKLGYIIPKKMIFGIVDKKNRQIMWIGICGILLLIFPSYMIARSVASPLSRLSSCADRVAVGDFDAEFPKLEGNGEIPKLFRSFDSMRGDLKRYIHDLTESTKAEEWFHAQLMLARSIQLGIVPKSFDDPKEANIDLYAMMKPAQEVGGDLYDFAILDEDHFYFCIGDVSGKGIPASLFMAMGKTLIRTNIQAVRDPAKTLTRVNKELMGHNEAGLFITALCGIYHRDTHELELSCAGHNPPVVIDRDGAPRFMREGTPDFPLAIMEDFEYSKFFIPFSEEETLFLYTDGVTDAVNPSDEFFGENHLIEWFDKNRFDSVRELVESIMANLERFADGAKQSDDITVLAFRPKTPGSISEGERVG